MDIVDTIVNGGLPEELVIKPLFKYPSLEISPYVRDPMLDAPSDEVTHLRTVFFREVVGDESLEAPGEEYKAELRSQIA